MEAAARSIAAYFDLMMQEGLAQQTFRFRERWEPRVTGLLCNAAEAAAHQLRPLLAEYAAAVHQSAYWEAVRWWQGRLRTIAATTVHAVANRTRSALAAALR